MASIGEHQYLDVHIRLQRPGQLANFTWALQALQALPRFDIDVNDFH